jgi:hypothetical protein
MAQPASATNTFDPTIVKPIVDKIEGFLADLDSERGSYMQRCRSIRDSMSSAYEEGKARGIPKKELRALVRTREKLRAARRVLDDLEPEQRQTVEMLAEAFGDAADLPLFAETINRAAA